MSSILNHSDVFMPLGGHAMSVVGISAAIGSTVSVDTQKHATQSKLIDDVAWLTKRVVHRLDGSGGYETQIDLEVNGDPTTDRHRSHFGKGGK